MANISPEIVTFGNKEFGLYRSASEIDACLEEMSFQIAQAYDELDPVLVSVERGGRETRDFVADYLGIPPEDRAALKAHSYEKDKTTGLVSIDQELDTDVKGKHVILIDDVDDTRNTLKNLRIYMRQFNPASLAVAVAFSKIKPEVDSDRIAEPPPEYIAMFVDDIYIIGRGLDTDHIEASRELNDLYAIREVASEQVA